MADLGTVYVKVAPNMTGIQGKIAAGFKGSAGPATAALGDEINNNSGKFQSALGGLGTIAKVGGAAIATGIAAGVAGIAALTGKALMAGAELEQQLGGAEVVFGEYATNIKDAAKDAYFTAGLSQNEFLQGANKMGSLFQGAGFSVKDSMEMSTGAMQRASDVASIMGIDTTTALEAVTGMAKGNFTMMDNLGVAMNDTAIAAFAVSKGINKSTQEMSAQEKIGLAQQLFMEKTAKFAGNYSKENQSLAGSINSTKKAFDNLMSGEGEVDGFIELLVNTIELAVPKIVALLPKIVDGIGQTLGALVNTIPKVLPTLLPALIGAVVSLITALVAALPSVINMILAALPLLIDAFIKLFLAIVQALPVIVQNIANALPTIINALVAGLTAPAALQAIIMGAVQLLLALLKAIPIIIPALAAAIPQIVRNIIATLTQPQFIAAMINAGVQLLKATITGIYSMSRGIASAAWNVIKIIASTLSPSNLFNIGKDVVKGLWNGIQDMGGWLKNKVVQFVKDKIPGPVKKALGIQSPSRVFAAIGREIPRGAAIGINKSAGLVEKAVTNMANNAIGTMTGPVLSPSVAFSSTAGSMGAADPASSNQTISIENVNLGDAGSVREFFRQINSDTMITGMGLTPHQGAQ